METLRSERRIRFRTFALDPYTHELYRDGLRLKLQGHPIEMLTMLLERPGELVTREELQRKLWPAHTYVDFEHGLNSCMNRLREALGDHAERPRYIETLPRLGYRFIAPVEEAHHQEPLRPTGIGAASASDPPQGFAASTAPPLPAPQAAAKTERAKGTTRNLWLAVLAAAALAALVLAFLSLYRPLPAPRIADYVQLTHDGQLKFPVATDGNRIYLNKWMPRVVAQVPISGGEIAPIPMDVPEPWVRDISPDGSRLIVLNSAANATNLGLWIVGVTGHPARYVTLVTDAVWSPDGQSIVYATSDGGIDRIPAQGGPPHLLAAVGGAGESEAPIRDLSIAPDNSSIRFTRENEIWEMTSAGTGLHPLLSAWRTSQWKCCGRWTSDGAVFLFLTGSSFARTAPFFPGDQIWALDERHGRARRPMAEPILLASGPMHWGQPIPARNGEDIFARGVTLRGELDRYDLLSQEFQPFLQGISAEFVDFSKDGKSVAYVSFPDGILWRANRDGSGVIQLTGPPFYPKFPRWSPDGSRILFQDQRATGKDLIYVLPAQGGNPGRLLPEEERPQAEANWSPDGKQVVYATGHVSGWGLTGKTEVRVAELASGRTTAVPESEGMTSPRWSPDGRTIAALSSRGSRALKVFDLESQEWRVLQDGRISFPNWSHDGRYLYFLRPRDAGVFRVPLAGGSPVRVVDLSAFRETGWAGAWLGLDPGDAPLLLRDVGMDEIYALKLERK